MDQTANSSGIRHGTRNSLLGYSNSVNSMNSKATMQKVAETRKIKTRTIVGERNLQATACKSLKNLTMGLLKALASSRMAWHCPK